MDGASLGIVSWIVRQVVEMLSWSNMSGKKSSSVSPHRPKSGPSHSVGGF